MRRYDSGADSVMMSDEDYEAIQRHKQQWQASTAAGNQAGAQAAHDAAEQLRRKYNYSGGGDGSDYIGLEIKWNSNTASRPKRTDGMGEFTYEKAPEYSSKYQGQIDDLLDDILNRPEFSYDPESDPRYGAYKKEYAREGQRATADTMGQMAAMTGGMPSTAAAVAGQQAGDYYASQMADKIPELYELAYSMYRDEGDSMRLNMDLLTALEQGDYNKYLNALAQHNNDRNFAYGVYRDQWDRNYQLDRDGVNDSRYDMEWNYGVGRDELEDSRYQDETEYARALEKAQTLAAGGDFSGYKAMGYSDQEIANLKKAYDREQAAGLLSRGGGSGGSKGRDRNSGEQDYDGLFKAAQASGHAKSFIANNYKKYGFTSSSGLYDDYMGWEEDSYGPGYSTVVGGGTVKGSEWDAVKHNLLLNLRAGNFDAAEQYMDQMAGGLSKEQWNELAELMRPYGYKM